MTPRVGSIATWARAFVCVARGWDAPKPGSDRSSASASSRSRRYERGANQLSAAKLWALDGPVSYVFEGLGPDGAPRTDVRPGEPALTQAFWSAADAGEWVWALAVLGNPRLRRPLLSLVQALIGEA